MATASTTYPKISRKLWFLVRDRLKKAIPSAITPTFVISISAMAEGSARSNVIGPLRELGLINEDNKPTELAERWRHDDDYQVVCCQIQKNVYPSDLVEAFPDAGPSDKDAIKSWFMKVGKVGEAAARMYADTYILLSQADLTKSEEKPVAKSSPAKTTPAAKLVNLPKKSTQDSLEKTQAPPATENARRLPAIHIDVQVHISPDTSADQIDRIFESMAKHLGTYIK